MPQILTRRRPGRSRSCPIERFHYRYGLLLALILMSIGVQLAAPDGDTAHLFTVVLGGATLVAAVLTSRSHVWVVRLTIVVTSLLVVASAGALVSSEQFGADSARVVTLLLIAVTPPAIVVGLSGHFREEQEITLQTMFGVLCLYLIVGLFFGSLFGAIQALGHGNFFHNGARSSSDFLYFSYTTLTTVGYGDLIPSTNLGRSLAVTEALIGQIYLVTVVALIVANLRPGARGSRRGA